MPRNLYFRGVTGQENVLTGDGRLIGPDALDWSHGTPMPLGFARASGAGHGGAVTVGSFTEFTRDGDDIVGRGAFADFGMVPEAFQAAYLVASGHAPGVSFDLSRVSVEFLVREGMFESVPDDSERKSPLPGYLSLFSLSPDDEIMFVSSADVRGATLVSRPAFSAANLEVVDEDGNVLSADDVVAFATESLIAMGAPEISWDLDVSDVAPAFRIVDPPASFLPSVVASGVPPASISADAFSREASSPTPLTVDGNFVYGHVALWDECHTSFPGQCVSPPRNDDFARFHISPVDVTAPDGTTTTVRVGRLSHGGGHADPKLGPIPTLAHYDDVAATVAFVRASNDAHGIFVCGVLADDVPDDVRRSFAAAPISGDWRRVNGALTLHAVCSVSTPGFVRSYLAASGEPASLVAAGVLRRPVVEPTPQPVDPFEIGRAVVIEIQRAKELEEIDEVMAAVSLADLDDVMADATS